MKLREQLSVLAEGIGATVSLYRSATDAQNGNENPTTVFETDDAGDAEKLQAALDADVVAVRPKSWGGALMIYCREVSA